VALAISLIGVASAQAKTVTALVGAGGDKTMRAPQGVVQGDTVVFQFQDNGHDMGLGGPERTKVDEQREGFRLERTLDRPGTYSFACSLHDDMSATFEVAPAAGAPANTSKAFDEVDVVIDGDGDGGVAPGALTIEEGQTVHWNGGKDSYDVSVAGRSGSANFGGTPFKHTFTSAGEYSYSTSEGGGTVRVVPAGSLNDGIRLAPEGSTPAASVTVANNSFSPAAVTIDEGQVVQWNWSGGPHNVKFEDGSGLPVKSSGGSGALKFYVPRDTAYSYVCDLHSGMSGTVLVRDTGAAGPNEQPPAPDAQVGGGGDGSGSGSGGSGSSGSSGKGAGVAGLAAAAASVAGKASGSAARDSGRPVLRGLRASFRRGRRSNRLRLTASEDVQLRISLRRLGGARDLVTRRAMRVYMRKGARSVRLPVLNLSAGSYRLRVVAVDQSGNRSAPVTLRLTVRR
jgi:plastocyanin